MYTFHEVLLNFLRFFSSECSVIELYILITGITETKSDSNLKKGYNIPAPNSLRDESQSLSSG